MKYALLFFLSTNFSTTVFAAEDITTAQATFPVEYVNSCKGLSESDGCQVHSKSNSLLTGVCKTKIVTPDDFELVCIPEQANTNGSQNLDTNASPDLDPHRHKRKHH